MPELPEVETVRRDLEGLLAGRRIMSVKVISPVPLRGYPETRFKKRLRGQAVVRVGRRAKILIIEIGSGDCLLVHLKMSGRLVYLDPAEPSAKHTHLMFLLDNGYELRFVDMRKFGYLKLVEGCNLNDIPELSRLGPEPLSPDFSAPAFVDRVRAKAGRRSIKAALLDQTVLAGVGNLYADEILHRAKVLPERTVLSISDQELKRIYKALVATLTRAIELRGTSFDLYVDAHGRPGAFAEELRVYGRPEEPCLKCGAKVKKIRVAGRGTHFCPNCQK